MLRLLSKTGGVTDGIHGNVCASYEFRDLQNQTFPCTPSVTPPVLDSSLSIM